MESKIIDIDGLLHRAMDDRDFAKDILTDYLSETPEMLTELKKSVNISDINNCISMAHKIKGASASAGANSVKIISENIEEFAKNSDINKIKSSLPKLLECFKITTQIIKNLDLMK